MSAARFCRAGQLATADTCFREAMQLQMHEACISQRTVVTFFACGGQIRNHLDELFLNELLQIKDKRFYWDTELIRR